jgi:carboxymethylenebutenolidase
MATERTLSSAWDHHLASEFAAKSADQALATMTAEPYVNIVPLMIGARGAHRTARLLREPFPVTNPTGHRDGYRLADHRAGPGRR